MQHQRRQGEVVNQLGLVIPIAKVGQVIGVRDIRLGDQQNMRSDFVQDEAQQLDDAMRLRAMDAGSADLLSTGRRSHPGG